MEKRARGSPGQVAELATTALGRLEQSSTFFPSSQPPRRVWSGASQPCCSQLGLLESLTHGSQGIPMAQLVLLGEKPVEAPEIAKGTFNSSEGTETPGLCLGGVGTNSVMG